MSSNVLLYYVQKARANTELIGLAPLYTILDS